MTGTQEKDLIEQAIERARDGVGERIDELDQHLRSNFDPKTLASTYAPQMVAGGAILGVIVGFGMPRILRKVVTWGVPLAMIAMAVKNASGKRHETPAGFD